MKLMEDRISQDAIIEDGEILKVGSFLNQQIDVPFISRCAEEFHRLFGEEGITRILTIEASGIGLACLCAVPFGVPVVFAKKSRSSNIAGEVYTSQVFSFTHGTEHRIMIPTSSSRLRIAFCSSMISLPAARRCVGWTTCAARRVPALWEPVCSLKKCTRVAEIASGRRVCVLNRSPASQP